jgi:hypothetical protein
MESDSEPNLVPPGHGESHTDEDTLWNRPDGGDSRKPNTLDYLAHRLEVTFTPHRDPVTPRVRVTIDMHGHVNAYGTEYDLLEEWGIVELHQVDAGPSFEPFLTREWEDRLAPQLRVLKDWQVAPTHG